MKKILVVEDAQSLRKDILEMLSFEGFEAIGAENGLIGVERARAETPDLILCDIMMPGMDGYGVLETLRSDPATANIPFIFLTARTDRVDMRQGIELGADDYLTKPFTANELLSAVRVRLDRRDQIVRESEAKLESLRHSIILALPHELRTPLNIILGFSELLVSDGLDMEGVRVVEMAKYMHTAGQRLYRMIENYLIYAHIEIVKGDAAQMNAIRQGITLTPKAPIQAIAEARAAQYERSADLVFQLEDVQGVKMMEDYLKRLVEELTDNACKFSPAGTPLTVSAAAEDGMYAIRFIDRGRGITRQQIIEIGAYMQFERRVFEQQGSGLGLVICKRLIDLHEGDLQIDSSPEGGTTVTIMLPLLVRTAA